MFEDGGNRDAHPRLDRETPLSRVSPDQEVEEREDETFAPPLDEEDIDVEECVRLLRRFRAERERLRQHCRELQAKLAHYFNSKTADDGQQERGGTAIDRDYRKHMAILADLKWRQARITEAAQQQTEELKRRSQEKLDQVEKEWRDLMALKQDVLVTVLRGKLGKQAAQAKVEQIQASEHHHEDKLVKARLENIRLKNKIRKYQVTDCPKEEQEKRLQLLCSELMSESKALNEKIDMQNKELLKLSNKIIATTEVLTHVKEKFQWSLTENHAKRSRLAEVRSTVAEKRDALTRLKQACNSLRADNLRLKERRGLLGNTVLLRDYEDQVDACDHLEEQLRQLRLARAELVPKSGRRRKKRL
ncbi:coiled-coil domain-containing protein 96 [Lampris incognitus]|uniref:coiled-coil domain-containing protein 96 n=1 Tax=Lampris incognitus TaxID=2546036 RepID=UPI0024B532FE|nr:coiled-coil domain-containing protein 96 [Lampris incognitus]